jgi:DNA-binding XRE family transcriptional regulator
MRDPATRRLVRQDLRQCIERACAGIGRAIAAWHKATATRRSKVKALREARGWSQPELARRAKVSQSTVCRIERGADMGASTALRLACALGVRVEDVAGGRRR